MLPVIPFLIICGGEYVVNAMNRSKMNAKFWALCIKLYILYEVYFLYKDEFILDRYYRSQVTFF